MTDLITRIEGGSGGDRELDCEIAVELLGFTHDGQPAPYRKYVYDPDGVSGSAEVMIRKFTSSLDAAIALTERLLPGWTIAAIGQDDNKRWHCELRDGFQTSYGAVIITIKCTTPARALLAATLRAHAALKAKETSDAE